MIDAILLTAIFALYIYVEHIRNKTRQDAHRVIIAMTAEINAIVGRLDRLEEKKEPPHA